MDPQNRSARLRWVAAAGAAYLGWQLVRHVRSEELTDKVVLITGGSRGLGLLLAREFAHESCRIAILARDAKELAAAMRDLSPVAPQVLTLPCDVADRGEVVEAVARVEERLGTVDVLVNNAGIIQVGPIDTMAFDDFERAMATIFWGALHTTLAVLPGMRARGGGRIVNITSIGGKVAVPHLLPYGCAKFAMVGFSEGMRAELAREGIRVTTVVPGLMRTGSPVNALFKGNQEREWDWFALSSATPLTTMSAARAARRIVAATKRGEAEVTLTWQAKLLRLAHDLFPGATADLLGAVNRLLPRSSAGADAETPGMRLATAAAPSALTTLMNRAARETHQFEGNVQPSRRHAERIGLDSH